MMPILPFLMVELAPRFIGEITLMTAAAVFVGFGTYKALPPSMNPKFFAVLVPFLVLGSLAYMGSYTAATSVVLFILMAIAAIALGVT